MSRMAAVVLRGPSGTAPESIIGPFVSLPAAEEWAGTHPRDGGYCVATVLTDPAEVG